MPHYLSPAELDRTAPAETAAFRSPVPTQIVSNGEYNPLPQTREQQRVEARIKEMADQLGRRHGMSRRSFLASAAGMAAAFLAMNEVFGPVFDVAPRRGADARAWPTARADALAGQFIFDDQTHFVRDDFNQDGPPRPGQVRQAELEPGARAARTTSHRYKFENYVKEIFVDSDTKVALLSGAPFDDPTWDLLTNDQIAAGAHGHQQDRRLAAPARRTRCSRRRRRGWMDEVDRVHRHSSSPTAGRATPSAIRCSRPSSARTGGSTTRSSCTRSTRRSSKSGINTICIHKGLLPADYEKSWPDVVEVRHRRDVGKAAKDWPQLNFVIYHGALRPFLESPDGVLAEFEQDRPHPLGHRSGGDPGEVRREATSTARSARRSRPARCPIRASPPPSSARWSAASGADHVVWGTDSVWYGSPQWQIEAMRRLEIPEDMHKKHEFAPLGPADGRGEDRHLRRQLGAPLPRRRQGGARRDHQRQDRRDQGGVRRHGR